MNLQLFYVYSNVLVVTMTVEEDKEILGFDSGTSALYRQWRNKVKSHMESNGFNSRRSAGDDKWQALTEYALRLRPLAANASVHGTGTRAGIAMQRALNNLLVDTGKKLKDTQALYGGVRLIESACPDKSPEPQASQGTLNAPVCFYIVY